MILVGTPHTKGAGYFINDRALSTRQEADIRTCPHCECIIKMHLWRSGGGFCKRCFAPICLSCSKRMATYGCENFLRRIDKELDSIVKYHQHLKVAGLEPTPQLKGA